MVEMVSGVSVVALADLQQPDHASCCRAPQPPDPAWLFLSEGLLVALRQLRQVISLDVLSLRAVLCSLRSPSDSSFLILADYVRGSCFRGDQLSGRETRCYPDEQSAQRWSTTCC